MDICSLARGNTFSQDMFYNLTVRCRNDDFTNQLDMSPATFFIQMVRVILAISVTLALLTLYNLISVLDRCVLSTATCSLYWVIMVIIIGIKSAMLMVFPIVHINFEGFWFGALLQSLATFLLFVALDHERKFRSADFATVDSPSKHCVALNCSFRLLCSWSRLVALLLTVLPITLLIAIEALFANDDHLLKGNQVIIVWVYIGTLPLTRLASVVVGVVLMIRTGCKLAPTLGAKIYLALGLILSLMEDIPNFVTSCGAHHCRIDVLSVYDLIQLVGATSLIFFLLFVRSQYLRIEQESKLNLVWDLQKLLQVNGRKDIIRHYT